MDPRLEFAFQLLIDATGLSRHELMDYVFEENMVNYLYVKRNHFFNSYDVRPLSVR